MLRHAQEHAAACTGRHHRVLYAAARAQGVNRIHCSVLRTFAAALCTSLDFTLLPLSMRISSYQYHKCTIERNVQSVC